MSEHPLCCDCDNCIGPGVTLGYAPLTHTTPGRPNAALKDGVRRGQLGGASTMSRRSPGVLRAAYVRVMRRWQQKEIGV